LIPDYLTCKRSLDLFALRAVLRIFARLLAIGGLVCAAFVLWSLLQGESERLRKFIRVYLSQ